MNAWNEAHWNEDRWPSVAIADMLQTPPVAGRGALIGLDDWRYAVEIALPDDPAGVWGVGTWDDGTDESASWNSLQWHDLTPYSRGETWTTGSDEPYGRPRIGSLDVEIANPDDIWSPFNAARPTAYFGPGTIIRVSVHSPTHALRWLPQFTGLVDSWTFSTRGVGADRPISIQANQTLRYLSQIDENALDSVVGLDDDAEERISRLLEASDWPYGFKVDAENLVGAGTQYQLQSTDMAANRLSECYLSADSNDAVFRTDRTGAALLCAPNWFGDDDGADPDVWPLVTLSSAGHGERPYLNFAPEEFRAVSGGTDSLYVPYDADTFDVSNTDESVVNDVRLARSGGTQQSFQQAASIQRYGRRSLVRSDLLNRHDTTVRSLAYHTSFRRGLNSIRIENLDVSTSDRGDDVYLCMLAADIGASSFVLFPDGSPPGRPSVLGSIRSITHRVTPRNSGSVTWNTSVSIDTRTVYKLPAAQLPSDPEPV